MQQLRSHYRWFHTLDRLQVSTVLVIAFFLFALTNAGLLLLAQTPQNAHAQHVPDSGETTKASQQTEPAQVVPTTPPAPQDATPQPAPAPTRAATPAPVYDKVSIPSIGFSSQYVPVGLTSTSAVDVHPSLVGWFDRSAQPGTPGAAFLDGHNPGVFRKLPSVQVGAQISLTRASGEVFNYTVVHIDTVMLVDVKMSEALVPYGGALEGLNLMTCVGTYSATTGTTDQRLIVYAVRS